MKIVEDKAPKVLFILSGVVLAPIILIIGFVWGLKSGGHGVLAADTLSAWVAAGATVAIATLTFILARETWYLRLAQIRQIDELKIETIRPNLEFYLLSAPASFSMMNVHVQNNGKGTARNIKFEFFQEGSVDSIEQENALIGKFLSLNILKNGISSLGSGKERKSYIFNFYELNDQFGDLLYQAKIKILIKFENADGKLYSSESIVDFSEFKGLSEVGGGDALYNIYKQTEKIAKVIESFQTGHSSKRLNANVYSADEREK